MAWFITIGEPIMWQLKKNSPSVRIIEIYVILLENYLIYLGKKIHPYCKFQSLCLNSRNGNGILLDPTLTQGKTERCDTFDNPPLCKSGDFTIAAIEVYGLFKLDLCKGF